MAKRPTTAKGSWKGPWIVFWVRGGRVASVPLTRRNEAEAKRCMDLSLIQRDITGTKHYSVLHVRDKKCFR